MNHAIYVACDDTGYELKNLLLPYLSQKNYDYVDCGAPQVPSRYPYYASKVAAAISMQKANRGILICGSGIGMSIAANKFKGVRAALCNDPYAAYITRRHNDANILCLGGRMIGKWQAFKIVETFLSTEYDAGHHQGSLDLIKEMEDVMMKDTVWNPSNTPYPNFEWNPKQSV